MAKAKKYLYDMSDFDENGDLIEDDSPGTSFSPARFTKLDDGTWGLKIRDDGDVEVGCTIEVSKADGTSCWKTVGEILEDGATIIARIG